MQRKPSTPSLQSIRSGAGNLLYHELRQEFLITSLGTVLHAAVFIYKKMLMHTVRYMILKKI